MAAMGLIHDRAIAQAELRLRKKITGKVMDPSLRVADYDGCLYPRWVALAVEYAKSAILAYALEILDAQATGDPHARIDRVKRYPRTVTDYLFHEYFLVEIHFWNVSRQSKRPDDQTDDDEMGIRSGSGEILPMDEEGFYRWVMFYAKRSEYDTINDRVEQAVTKFWEERASGNRDGPSKQHGSDRIGLRDSYLAAFPNTRIKFLDICWAARQHYSEWKRWLRKSVKDGSAPDIAFRSLLTSGELPSEYRKQPRPDGWK
jgi:hypothetical protein